MLVGAAGVDVWTAFGPYGMSVPDLGALQSILSQNQSALSTNTFLRSITKLERRLPGEEGADVVAPLLDAPLVRAAEQGRRHLAYAARSQACGGEVAVVWVGGGGRDGDEKKHEGRDAEGE